MVINGVKDRINSLKEIGFYQNSSSFVLCDYVERENGKKELEVIPLENGLTNVKVDKREIFLTDIDGNVLLDFSTLKHRSTLINYVNGEDIIISDYDVIRPNFVFKKIFRGIDHYKYKDGNLEHVTCLFDGQDTSLKNFEFPSLNNDTLLIETIENLVPSYQVMNFSSRLYSVSQGKYISPSFTKLEEVSKSHGTLFKFTDRVRNSLTINNINYASNIIGFINIDGKFYDGVYDELTNKEIECSLNSKPNFEEYYEIRKMVEGKLNEKVVKESNKLTTRDFVLKKLENRAKNNISK